MAESGTESGIDLAAVVAEIDAEARRMRLSGEVDSKIEADLAEAFDRYAPMSTRKESLAGAMRSLGAATLIDVDVPTASSIPGGTFTKRLFRKALRWYLSYLAMQVRDLGLTTLGVVQSVVARLSLLESRLAEVAPVDPLSPNLEAQGSDIKLAKALGSTQPWVVGEFGVQAPVEALGDAVSEMLSQKSGRILHAECGDGWLLRRLVADGLDVYGVDPRPQIVGPLVSQGLDAWDEPVRTHLATVQSGSLSAVILSGLIERLSVNAKRDILEQAVKCLGPKGSVIILSVTPQYWSASSSPVEVDLSPGGPFHEQTWQALLAQESLVTSVLPSGQRKDAYIVCGTKAG